MTKDQKQFIIGLGIIAYCFLTLLSTLNALFNNDFISQIIPIPFLVIPLIAVYISLGKKRKK